MLSGTRELVNCVYLREMQILQFPIVLPMDATRNKKLSYCSFKRNTWDDFIFIEYQRKHLPIDFGVKAASII
jgi:hypothetical protein